MPDERPKTREEAYARQKAHWLGSKYLSRMVVEDDSYPSGLRYRNQGGAICQPKSAGRMQPEGPACPTCGGWGVVPCYHGWMDPPEPEECLDCSIDQDCPTIHDCAVEVCGDLGALSEDYDIMLEAQDAT